MTQAETYSIDTGNVTITMSGTHTITSNSEETTNTMTVNSNVVANITLENVNIDVSGVANTCAFDISQGAHVILVLSEINTLKSNGTAAGLQINEAATLMIEDESNSHRLTVYGGG